MIEVKDVLIISLDNGILLLHHNLESKSETSLSQNQQQNMVWTQLAASIYAIYTMSIHQGSDNELRWISKADKILYLQASKTVSENSYLLCLSCTLSSDLNELSIISSSIMKVRMFEYFSYACTNLY